MVANIPGGEYPDGIAYDPEVSKLYVSDETGGTDTVIDTTSNQVIATIPTKPGAKTARLVPELNRYYVGVPGNAQNAAQILAFEVVP